ncbi:MAG TPA: ABC transporter permease, partial [Synergistetes bacterium]|nr:ABC transporter permease [Synergistota bacterium]
MLNYVAIHLVEYYIYGPWRDPSSLGFPMTAPFPASARLPLFFDSRVHLGIFAAIILVLAYRLIIRWTRWGFEIRAIGDNPKAAAYAGILSRRNIVLLLFVSGAVAGMAGMIEISGLQGRLQHGFSPGYGYTAIIVAWLARLNPWGIIIVSFFMGVLLVGGDTLQVVMRLPVASVQVIQGCILFAVLASEFIRNYRVQFIRKERE